eukprot:gene18799-25344_t
MAPPKPETEEQKIEMQAKAIASLREMIPAEVASKLEQAGEEGVTNAFLLRWLRARKWDISNANRDIAKHADWAVEMKPEGFVPLDHIAVDLKHQKFCIQGITNVTNRPVVFTQAARHKPADSLEYFNSWPVAFTLAARHIPHKPADSIKHFISWCLDTLILYGDVMLGDEWDGKIDMVFDLTDFGYKSFDLAVLPIIFSTLQDHYVERLGVMYICHAPFIFWGMWKLVSPFIDPVTKQKIRFVEKATAAQDLSPLYDMLPPCVGGTAELHHVETVHAELKEKAKAKHEDVAAKQQGSTAINVAA